VESQFPALQSVNLENCIFKTALVLAKLSQNAEILMSAEKIMTAEKDFLENRSICFRA
jgi:hypothetical protein